MWTETAGLRTLVCGLQRWLVKKYRGSRLVLIPMYEVSRISRIVVISAYKRQGKQHLLVHAGLWNG